VAIQDGVDLNYFVGPTPSTPDAVSFRLDVPSFIGTLNERDRGIAMTLANGHGTTVTARKFGVSPGAISQARTRLRRKYDEFHAAI
jgi:hypothetical protein